MSKDLIMKTFRHEKTDQVPWVPFSGVHAGTLKGYTAREVLTDGDKLFESLAEVHKIYTPDGMPIMFDLQVEAEIMGCDLLWAKDNPPSVKSHPFEGKEKKIPCRCRIPKATDGRIPMIVDVMKRAKKSFGDDTALYGLICGPATLASHLRGNDFFMDIIKDKEFASAMFAYCCEVAIAMAGYYMDAGMDVIAVVDPIISQIAPKAIEKLFLESYQSVFDYIRGRGALSSFFVCGDATAQIDVMCRTHADGVSVDENVNLAKVKEITDRYNVVIGGNIPLTTVMLFGTQQDNMKYVVDLMDTVSHENLIVSPGCDMPYNVPVDNTVACVQAVKHTDEVREMIANYEAVDTLGDVELPDYAHLEKPLVEVFTLDPVQCAACTYMKSAAEVAQEVYGDKIDFQVYRYCVKEDIARTQKMGVEHLPSIYINGKIKWSSIIPSREEMLKAVEEVL